MFLKNNMPFQKGNTPWNKGREIFKKFRSIKTTLENHLSVVMPVSKFLKLKAKRPKMKPEKLICKKCGGRYPKYTESQDKVWKWGWCEKCKIPISIKKQSSLPEVKNENAA